MSDLKYIINDTDDSVDLSSVIDKIKNLEKENTDLKLLLKRKTERIVELEETLVSEHRAYNYMKDWSEYFKSNADKAFLEGFKEGATSHNTIGDNIL